MREDPGRTGDKKIIVFVKSADDGNYQKIANGGCKAGDDCNSAVSRGS